MTLWGQLVFWPDHVLHLNNWLWTRTRILNCVKMFSRGLNSIKNKIQDETHPFSGPRASLSALHNTWRTNFSENKSHFWSGNTVWFPMIVSSGWPSCAPSVLQREWMNRWFYLLKCLLIHTDILGMKSIYFVITAKIMKRKVQFGEFSWCFGIEISV